MVNQVIKIDPNDMLEIPKESNCLPIEETKEVVIESGNPSRTVRIKQKVDDYQRQDIISLLHEFADIFA